MKNKRSQLRLLCYFLELTVCSIYCSARLPDHNHLNSMVSQLQTNAKGLGLLNVSRSMPRAPTMSTVRLAKVQPITGHFYHRGMCKKMLLQISRCKQVKQEAFKNSIFMVVNTEAIKPPTTTRSLKLCTYIRSEKILVLCEGSMACTNIDSATCQEPSFSFIERVFFVRLL